MKTKNKNLDYILPFGYLFLILLGIIRESIYFNQIGLNILRNTSISDILLSPVADITNNWISFICFLLIISSIYLIYIVILPKHYNKRWFKKLSFSQKNKLEGLNEEQFKAEFLKSFLIALALGLFGFYTRIGFGDGSKLKSKIENDQLTYKHQLIFMNDQEASVIHLIRTNSINYFFVEKGSKNVKISPISSVKTLEFIAETK